MKRSLLIIIMGMAVMLMFSSCAEQYMLSGTTNVHELEGKTLYLKVFQKDDLKNIDSCTVTHGKFAFSGREDSVEMANIFVGEQSLLPVVLEGNNLKVKMEDVGSKVTGSALNDTLYKFIRQKTQIDNKISELPNKEARMVMDGEDHDQVVVKLNAEYANLMMQSDHLVTSFIKANYTNVLGPGVFMIMTSGMRYPELTPLIEELLTSAPDCFLNDPYVKMFVEQARANTDAMEGR